jgi:hypothetical protein
MFIILTRLRNYDSAARKEANAFSIENIDSNNQGRIVVISI